MRIFIHDLRFSLRTLRKSPSFTAVAILSLALGIGSTIAIFSVIYGLALRPLPVQKPNQLVEVERAGLGNLHSYAEWKIFRERQDIFAGVLAYNHSDVNFHLANANQQEDVNGSYVSGDYFSTLGVSAALGRVLQSSDDLPGAPPVCVLGYGLWRRLYGQSRDVLGLAIRLNGNEFQIVGVAPRSFYGVDIGGVPEIFMPLEAERTYGDYPIRYGKQTPSLDSSWTIISIAGRLRPGISVSQANAGLQVLAPEVFRALPAAPEQNGGKSAVHWSLSARSMANGTSDSWLQNTDLVVLLMAMAAVALVIACANLGNLLLARAAKRRIEISTRLALGATRWRLVRLLLTESVALSAAGGLAGLLLARWGSQALLWALSYPDDPILLDLSWDARLAAFAVGITFGCAVLFGLAPAFRATRVSLSSAMNNGVPTGRPGNKFMNSLLVVAQVALSVAILVSAGLLTRTLRAFLSQDLGYDANGVLTAPATWQGSGENPKRKVMVGQEVLMAFRSVPGVTSASWSRSFARSNLAHLVLPMPGGSERRFGVYLHFNSSGFFKTRRTPLLAGRDFNDGDSNTSPKVAILSEALAKALFGGATPVGLRFREDDQHVSGQDYYVEVVGVAGDIQYRRPDYGPLFILYRPVSQCGDSCLDMGSYEIRAEGGFAETTINLTNAARAVDPRVSLKFGLLRNAMDSVLHRNRAMASIATTFGLFVALLAMIGVYGVTSQAAAERTREIGIRMALGAEPRDVFRILFGEMMRVVCIGIVFGVGAVFGATQIIRGTIWGVKPTDPLSFGFAICLMVLIAGIAATLPARRAMKVDPMVALRCE